MPRQSEAERCEMWSERISERQQDLRERIALWEKYLRHYRADLLAEEQPPEDSVWINYLLGISRIVVPSIYFQNPEVLIRPRGTTPLSYATLLELEMNYILEKLGFEDEMRAVIFDTLVCGVGVMKFGFLGASKKSSSLVEDMSSWTEESLFDELALEEASASSGKREVDSRIDPNLPFAIRISPRKFLVDPLAEGNIKQARWVIHKITRPVEEVKKDRRYPRGLTSGIGAAVQPEDRPYLNAAPPIVTSAEAGGSLSGEELVNLYEIWDREANKLLVLDEYNMLQGKRKFLREETCPYDLNGFPFETLVFNPDPDRFHGVSDFGTWWNPANALNLLNSLHYNHVKKFTSRKIGVENGGLVADEDEVALIDARDALYHTNGPPEGVVTVLRDAPLPPDNYNLRGVLKQELDFISGLTEQRRGISGKAMTATEASIMEQMSRVRDNDRLGRVTKFVEHGVKKLLYLVREFVGASYAEFIVGSEMAKFWREVGDDVLQSEVDVKVRVGSSAFISREVRTQQYLAFLNITKDWVNPETGRPYVDPREAIRRLTAMMEIDDAESLLTGLEPPLPFAAGAAPPKGGRGSGQTMQRQSPSGANLGEMLSRTQNFGIAQRTPNPTEEVGT